MEDNPHIAPQYRGLYYRYNYDREMWDIYDNFYTGNRWLFNGNTYRIDECFYKIFNDEIPF